MSDMFLSERLKAPWASCYFMIRLKYFSILIILRSQCSSWMRMLHHCDYIMTSWSGRACLFCGKSKEYCKINRIKI